MGLSFPSRGGHFLVAYIPFHGVILSYFVWVAQPSMRCWVLLANLFLALPFRPGPSRFVL